MSQSNYHKLQDAVDYLREACVILAGLNFKDGTTEKFMWGSVRAAYDYCRRILRDLEEGKIK